MRGTHVIEILKRPLKGAQNIGWVLAPLPPFFYGPDALVICNSGRRLEGFLRTSAQLKKFGKPLLWMLQMIKLN